jgi:glycosyltransferase involved in cell wall biosynthesis
MADRGCSVALLTRTHDLEFGGAPGAMQAFVDPLLGGHVDHRMLAGRVRDPAQLHAVRELRHWVRRLEPDVVHFQDGVLNDVRLLVAAGVRPKRYAYTVHDATPHPGDRRTLPQRLGRNALLHSAGLIFVHSERVAEALAAQSRRLPPIELVPHGIDVAEPAPLPDRPALLFFGRIGPYKGVDVLLDALPLIWRRVPELTLTIAGAGTLDDHAKLRDRRVIVRNEHVRDGEVPALFAAATCCVLPYREASQSGVGSQARAYGRPIVATRVGGLPELVGPDAGRLVAPGDVVALAEAVIEVLTTPGLAESMSRASGTWVRDAAWDRVGELTLDAYQRHLPLASAVSQGPAERKRRRSRSSRTGAHHGNRDHSSRPQEL